MKAKLLITFLMGLGALLNMANAAVGVDASNLPPDLLKAIQRVCMISYPLAADGITIDWGQVISASSIDSNGSYVETVCDEGINPKVKIKSRFYYTDENYKLGFRNILGSLVLSNLGSLVPSKNLPQYSGSSGNVFDLKIDPDDPEANGFPQFMKRGTGWAVTKASKVFYSNEKLTTNSQTNNEMLKMVSNAEEPTLEMVKPKDTISPWLPQISSSPSLIKSEYLISNRNENPDYKVEVRNFCYGDGCQNLLKRFVYVSVKGKSLSYVFGLSFTNNIYGNTRGVDYSKTGFGQYVSIVCLEGSQCSIEGSNLENYKLTWLNGSYIKFIYTLDDVIINLTEPST